jgi:RND family efflux transporter MFP subunit
MSIEHVSRFAVLVTLLAAACGGNEYAPPPPPKVTAALPVSRSVTRYAEYTGTTRAIESVQVRARVKGFLLAMHFQAGDFVEQGALLFTIDPEPFEIALSAAAAAVKSNEAELALATTEYQRTRKMFKQNATSEIKLIQMRAKRDKADAELAASKADVKSAELDLDYASVSAPISGRVGRHEVDMGNLVGAEEATLLTTMVSYTPLYVYFHISERALLSLQKVSERDRVAAGESWENRPPTPLQVGRSNDAGYPHEGVIDFTALEVDPDTGTFEVRGVLPNEGELDGVIIPGTFVRVRIPISFDEDALLVNERALGADQTGRFVLIVNDEGIVEHRRVEVGPIVDGYRVIESGLEPNEWVIVNGIQKARPGSHVDATRTEETAGDEQSAAGPSEPARLIAAHSAPAADPASAIAAAE